MRWDPLQDLVSWHERLRGRGAVTGWTPAIDVYETPEAYVLVAELAGLTADDFDLQATDQKVTISGRRGGHPGAERFLHVERGHGDFARSFAFPEQIAVQDISADFRNGLLTVTIPKQARKAPHRVPVGA